jgi:YidC/Oxa1 family membrane protein insertase
MFDFITKPFGWLMMFLYEFTTNYGLAVILFAFVVKAILLPFQMKSKRSMMRVSRLQPKLKELEKKHGANKQKLQEEQQKLYREEKVNPLSGCLWSLLPFPIIIALFQAISNPLTIMMNIPKTLLEKGGAIFDKLPETLQSAQGYLQIKQAQHIAQNFGDFQGIQGLKAIDYQFLGMDLGAQPKFDFLWNTTWSDPGIWLPGLLLFLLPIVSGVLAYFSSKVSMQMNPQAGGQQQSNKMMLLMMPLISVFFAFSMPAAIGVYIIASTAFAMIQDIILTKRYTKIMDAEDAVKFEQQRIKEAELEAKRLETERRKLENKTDVNPNTSKKKQIKTERQEQLEKAAEWEKKNAKTPVEETVDPSREGTRRFARGRAYDPDRFAQQDTEQSDQDESIQVLAAVASEKEEDTADEPYDESDSVEVADDAQDVTDSPEDK